MRGNRNSTLRLVMGLVMALAVPATGLSQVGVPPGTGPEPGLPPGLEDGVYLVTFQPGTPASDRAAAVAQSGAALRRNFSNLDVVSVRIPDEAALARLRAQGRVLSVVPSLPVTLAVASAPQGKGNGGKKPRAPSGLSASAISSSGIHLTWSDDSNDETGFAIERCTGAFCGDFAEIDQVGANVESYTDSGLSAGTLYRYRVLVFNDAGSRPSNTAEATTDSDGAEEPVPDAPTNLSTNAPDTTRVDLSWSDNSGNENGFDIERCDAAVGVCGNFDFVEIGQTAPNDTSFYDFNVASGQAYTYRVRAFNATGPSVYTNWSESTVPAGGGGGNQVVPAGMSRIGAAPGNLSVTGEGVGVAIVDTGLDFTHPDLAPAPESFSFYHLDCQDPHGHGTHVGGIVAAEDNDIDVVGVAPGATLYCVDVFTLDAGGNPVASDESIVAGLNWILANANVVDPPIRVVNMSLGRPRTAADGPTHPFGIAFAALHSANISVVVAAGNTPSVEVTDRVPASYPQATAVASVNAAEGLNGSANFPDPCSEPSIPADSASYFTTDGAFAGGVGVTISAPGASREDIGRYLFSCVVDPVGILSTRLGGGTVRLMGTSMAAPHVAGVIALMWEYEQDRGAIMPPETARTRIRGAADLVGIAPLDSPVTGYTFDGEREGIIWAPGAVEAADPPPPNNSPTVTILDPDAGSTFNIDQVIGLNATASDTEDGDLSGSIDWTSSIDGDIGNGASLSTTLSEGDHVITARVQDSVGNVATDTVSITVEPAEGGLTLTVSEIVYSEAGKHLRVTLGVSDSFGSPVEGTQVGIELTDLSFTAWNFSGSTDGSGQVWFQLNHAPDSCYVTEVLSLTSPGIPWDGEWPLNLYCMDGVLP